MTIFDRLWHRWIWPQRLAKSRAGAAVRWQERIELLSAREKEMVGAHCVFCWDDLKHTENLNKDGSHQLKEHFLFNILENQGKKVTLPKSLVANAITAGICPDWVFHKAHDQCFYICRSFGFKVGSYTCIVCSPCHVLHLSLVFSQILMYIKYASRRLNSKQPIIITTLHMREKRKQRSKWWLSNGFTISSSNSFLSTFAHCGFVFLFRLSESKMSVAFI